MRFEAIAEAGARVGRSDSLLELGTLYDTLSSAATPIVSVAWGEAEGKQFAAVVDHEMEFAAIEPSDRRLAAARVDGKDALLDPRRMTESERDLVDEADAPTRAALGMEVDGEGEQEA